MNFENIIQWMGGLLAYSALGIVLYGVWRGSQRQAGRVSGRTGNWLRSPVFYFFSSVFFFFIAWLGWTRIPANLTSTARTWMLAFGSLLYFPGMIFLLWGRMALGREYFVSTGFGAQLFKDHHLVTNGPYAIVRHPMYAGLILAAAGSLLLYFTWTTVYFACFAPLVFFRARREEQVLAAEFGGQWAEYCKRVPMFFPHLGKER